MICPVFCHMTLVYRSSDHQSQATSQQAPRPRQLPTQSHPSTGEWLMKGSGRKKSSALAMPAGTLRCDQLTFHSASPTSLFLRTLFFFFRRLSGRSASGPGPDSQPGQSTCVWLTLSHFHPAQGQTRPAVSRSASANGQSPAKIGAIGVYSLSCHCPRFDAHCQLFAGVAVSAQY